MIVRVVLVFVLLANVVACTDASVSKVMQLGSPQVIRCYSGGTLIYEGESTGKVVNEQNTDGYYWRDARTGKIVETSADCIFTDK